MDLKIKIFCWVIHNIYVLHILRDNIFYIITKKDQPQLQLSFSLELLKTCLNSDKLVLNIPRGNFKALRKKLVKIKTLFSFFEGRNSQKGMRKI